MGAAAQASLVVTDIFMVPATPSGADEGDDPCARPAPESPRDPQGEARRAVDPVRKSSLTVLSEPNPISCARAFCARFCRHALFGRFMDIVTSDKRLAAYVERCTGRPTFKCAFDAQIGDFRAAA
jgi:hypothetical protein